MTPIPVYLVRAKESVESRVGRVIAAIPMLFLTTWLVMLLLPIAFELHWSYWRTMAAILAIRLALPLLHRIHPRIEDIQ